MTNVIISKLETFVQDLKSEFSPEVKAVENKTKAIASSTLAYIESQSLQQLYTMATSALLAAATGTPWLVIAANLVSQGEAAGISIAKGAETIVLAQAQADLIAAGKLIAPTTGAVVTTPAA